MAMPLRWEGGRQERVWEGGQVWDRRGVSRKGRTGSTFQDRHSQQPRAPCLSTQVTGAALEVGEAGGQGVVHLQAQGRSSN